MASSALVVAAHPDDEVLGAGATVARLTAAGVGVVVLILASGVTLRHPGRSLSDSHAASERAARHLGIQHTLFADMGGADTLMYQHPRQEIVNAIASAVRDHCPETVFTHAQGDIHIDHRVVSECTVYALRNMSRGSVRNVWHYEVPSSTEQSFVELFTPQAYVDVSATIDLKIAAMSEYEFELDGLGRSAEGIRALAAYRGLQVAVPLAEAFNVGRQLWL